MEVGVGSIGELGGLWHVVVDYDVHSLNVDAPSEEIRRHQDPRCPILELPIHLKTAHRSVGAPATLGSPFALVHSAMDRRGGEVIGVQQDVELLGP